MFYGFVEKGEACREDDFGDYEMANGALVLLIVVGFQNGRGEGAGAVQRTDDNFRRFLEHGPYAMANG